MTRCCDPAGRYDPVVADLSIQFSGNDPSGFAKPGDPDLVVDFDRVAITNVVPYELGGDSVDMVVAFAGARGRFMDPTMGRYQTMSGLTGEVCCQYEQDGGRYVEQLLGWMTSQVPLRFTAAANRLGMLISSPESWLSLPSGSKVFVRVPDG